MDFYQTKKNHQILLIFYQIILDFYQTKRFWYDNIVYYNKTQYIIVY